MFGESTLDTIDRRPAGHFCEVEGRHMARALLGHVGMPNEHTLAYEVVRLRRRIAELEAEIDELRQHPSEVLDLELHQLAGTAEPALA